jgi:hypothetical protein
MTSSPPSARLSFKDRKSYFLLQAAGREFPDINEYWDGNWILFTVLLVMPGLTVELTDPCIRVDELEAFLLELRNFSLGHSVGVESSFQEPVVSIGLQGAEPGQDEILARIEVNIFTDDGISGTVAEVDVENTAIDLFIQGVEEILREYPVVARETH